MARFSLLILLFFCFAGAVNAALIPQRLPANGDGYGGNGGGVFDYSEWDKSWGPVSMISVRSGTNIDGIGIGYESGKFVYHGGMGGGLKQENLNPGEYISEVKVRTDGKLIRGLKFVIKNARQASRTVPFGDQNAGSEASANFNGKALLYIFGRSGTYLDAIGFGYGDQPESVAFPIIRSTEYGGDGGGSFSDLSDTGLQLGRITKIDVHHGTVIDNISTTYADTTKQFSHGGGGGGLATMTLRDGEYITKVEGRSGTVVDNLKFTTNMGMVKTFGGNGGSPFTINPPSNGFVVVGFTGRSGSSLDKIGVLWGKVEKVATNINIKSVTYDLANGSFSIAEPEVGQAAELINRSDQAQSISQSYTFTQTETASVMTQTEHSAGASLTVSSEFEKGVLVVGSKLTVSATASYNYTKTNGTTKESSREKSFSGTFTVNVGPKSKLKAQAVYQKQTINVPWTGIAEYVYKDGTREEKPISGTWVGVGVVNLRAEYGPSTAL